MRGLENECGATHAALAAENYLVPLADDATAGAPFRLADTFPPGAASLMAGFASEGFGLPDMAEFCGGCCKFHSLHVRSQAQGLS